MADVDLYVRPDEEDLAAVIAGLRTLAATASEMAKALSRHKETGERTGGVPA